MSFFLNKGLLLVKVTDSSSVCLSLSAFHLVLKPGESFKQGECPSWATAVLL
jgi:hypothetical protein